MLKEIQVMAKEDFFGRRNRNILPPGKVLVRERFTGGRSSMWR
jgi:hypothetical protein